MRNRRNSSGDLVPSSKHGGHAQLSIVNRRPVGRVIRREAGRREETGCVLRSGRRPQPIQLEERLEETSSVAVRVDGCVAPCSVISIIHRGDGASLHAI